MENSIQSKPLRMELVQRLCCLCGVPEGPDAEERRKDSAWGQAFERLLPTFTDWTNNCDDDESLPQKIEIRACGYHSVIPKEDELANWELGYIYFPWLDQKRLFSFIKEQFLDGHHPYTRQRSPCYKIVDTEQKIRDLFWLATRHGSLRQTRNAVIYKIGTLCKAKGGEDWEAFKRRFVMD